ncbi:MAG: putative Ig domain-containing protein [Candidatus Micrarchaeota archaeon]|nr:putative Ig domain-containing protein [Candidatus Micrarchaeota archaeon]
MKGSHLILAVASAFLVLLFGCASPGTDINANSTAPTTLVIASVTNGQCTVGETCVVLVAMAAGGKGAYTFESDSFATGAPPMGMFVNMDGALSGIPTKEGTYNFGVCVKDSAGASKCTSTRVLVNPEGVNSTPQVLPKPPQPGIPNSPAQPTKPEAGVATAPPETPPTLDNQSETQACTSPYEGTWKGTISDSGQLHYYLPSDQNHETNQQFAASYDLEFTMKCEYVVVDYDGGPVVAKDFIITHVKVSDPIFGCVDGCAPMPPSYTDANGYNVRGSDFYLQNDGTGNDLMITFLNNRVIALGGDIRFSPDGKAMTIPIDTENNPLGIGYETGASYVNPVESPHCPWHCFIDTVNPSTSTLTKVE